jgi:hypothetical protein
MAFVRMVGRRGQRAGVSTPLDTKEAWIRTNEGEKERSNQKISVFNHRDRQEQAPMWPRPLENGENVKGRKVLI